MGSPGANNYKALNWVKSHEQWDNDSTTIEYDVWSGHYVRVTQGDMPDEEFQAIRRRCWNLFHTSIWAVEWSEITKKI